MKSLATGLIKLYQRTISPKCGLGFFGFSVGCRFYPSCSEYSIKAIERYGVMKGIYKSIVRVFKCGPWSQGGVDLP